MHKQGIYSNKQLETLKYQRLQAIEHATIPNIRIFGIVWTAYTMHFFLIGMGWVVGVTPVHRESSAAKKNRITSGTTPLIFFSRLYSTPFPCNPIPKHLLPKNRWYHGEAVQAASRFKAVLHPKKVKSFHRSWQETLNPAAPL